MRTLYKNPMFDYKAFDSKKNRLIELLEKYSDSQSNWKPIANKISKHLSSCKDALNLAAFMTPFFVDLLAEEFDKEIEDFENSSTLANIVCSALVDNFTSDEDERVVKWIANATAQIYEACVDKESIGSIFNKMCTFYNSNCDKRASFVFTFPTNDFEKEQFISSFENALMMYISSEAAFDDDLRCIIDLVRVEIDCEKGFLSFMYVYLNSFCLDIDSRFWNFGNLAYVRIDSANSSEDAPIPLLSDIVNQYVSRIREVTLLPIWATSVLQEINIFSKLIHFTNNFDSTEITPTNLKTRSADYVLSPTVTFARDYIPFVTKAGNPRAVLYAWNENLVSNYNFAKYKDAIEIDGMFGAYGSDAIFLFCNISLSFLKTVDYEIQSICLLKDVIESVPCAFNKHNLKTQSQVAYLGIQADGKTPLFYVTESDWDRSKTPFVSFVLDSLCEFLDSEKYDPSMNLNITVRP